MDFDVFHPIPERQVVFRRVGAVRLDSSGRPEETGSIERALRAAVFEVEIFLARWPSPTPGFLQGIGCPPIEGHF